MTENYRIILVDANVSDLNEQKLIISNNFSGIKLSCFTRSDHAIQSMTNGLVPHLIICTYSAAKKNDWACMEKFGKLQIDPQAHPKLILLRDAQDSSPIELPHGDQGDITICDKPIDLDALSAILPKSSRMR